MPKTWEVVGTTEFSAWFGDLDQRAQDAVMDRVNVLRLVGPSLRRPYADTVAGSRHSNMKELIVPYRAIRVFFAFDRRRRAVLLIGGSKLGDKRFYEHMIRRADRLYDGHLERSS